MSTIPSNVGLTRHFRADAGGAAAQRSSFRARFLLGDTSTRQLAWTDYALIAAFALTLLGMNLGGARALTYHEVTFASPAKEMLRDGHWIVPTIAGVPFTDKPPLTAWLIAGSLAIFQTDAEWAVRLPSVLSAALTAALIAALACRWWGRRVGLLAGAMHLTTVATVMQARLAESDIHLCTTVCGALMAFAWANVESPAGRCTARWLPWAFFTCLGLAFLCKALVGPVFILGACGLYLLWSQDLRGFKFFLSPIGWLLCGLLIVPWFALAVRQYPPMLDNLLLHHFGRFKGNMGAHEPWYAYLYLMPMLLLPWTPLALWQIVRGLRDGAFLLPIYRFLVCWVAPGLILLSMSAFKAKHYTVPLLPPFVILGAIGAAQYLSWRRSTSQLHSRWLWACNAGGVLLAVAAILIAAPRGATGIILAALTAGAGLAVMIEFERRRRTDLVARTAFATAWVTMIWVAWFVLPAHDSYRPLAQLAARVNDRVPDGASIAMVRLPDNAMTYYLDAPIARYDFEEDFSASVANHRPEEPLYILAPLKAKQSLAAHGRLKLLDESAPVGRHTSGANRVVLFQLTPGPAEKMAQRP